MSALEIFFLSTGHTLYLLLNDSSMHALQDICPHESMISFSFWRQVIHSIFFFQSSNLRLT